MHKYGSSIEFIIDKFENNSIQISSLLFKNVSSSLSFNTSPTNIQHDTTSQPPYDSTGAAKYIVGFILVYGFAIVLFIGSQVKSSRKQDDNVDSQNAEQVLQQMESTIFTKEVLNKLLDKEHREKAWKIYLTNNEKKDSTVVSTTEEELLKQVVVQEAIDDMERKCSGKQPKPTRLEAFRKMIFSLCIKGNEVQQKNVVIKKTPQIRLQTDEEGLEQLKRATRPKTSIPDFPMLAKNNNKFLNASNNNPNDASLPQTKSILKKSKQLNHNQECSQNDVLCDVCEISEQITTV